MWLTFTADPCRIRVLFRLGSGAHTLNAAGDQERVRKERERRRTKKEVRLGAPIYSIFYTAEFVMFAVLPQCSWTRNVCTVSRRDRLQTQLGNRQTSDFFGARLP